MAETSQTSRATRKAATREALVDAGERLVRKRGFGVSVDEIAAEAGFTKGAVYSNFASRSDLIVKICERVIPGLQVDFDRSLGTLADALADSARQLVEAAATDAEQIVLQLDAMLQMFRDPDLREAILAEVSAEPAPEPLPWPLPLPQEQWSIAVNAVAIGLLTQRLLYGAEQVPDSLFAWLARRLA